MERLKDLSSETVSEISTNAGKKIQWRFHEIDWNAKNIPISRKELSWIDKAYLDNADEFVFQQFQISQALGRVVGFMDESGVFNIVLLDPLHNAQPSNFNAYKIRNTVITGTHFARVMVQIEERIAGCGNECGCRKIYGDLQGLINAEVEGPAVIVGMSEELFQLASACVSSGVAKSMAELVELGLGALPD